MGEAAPRCARGCLLEAKLGGYKQAWWRRHGAANDRSLRFIERGIDAVAFSLGREQDRWFLWAPVALALGIACYFALPREPWLGALLFATGLFAFLAHSARRRVHSFLALTFLACLAGGMLAGKLRAELVAAPVLEKPLVSADISGWIEELKPRQDGRMRIVLRVHEISGISAAKTSERVQITLRDDDAAIVVPGDSVRLKAYVQPPPEPPVPGGYDYARAAFFDSIGGVGKAHRNLEAWADAPPAPIRLRMAAPIGAMRLALAGRIRRGLDGEAGRIAAALITGLRDGIGEPVLELLRVSGLAHILAISGLHMSLMAGALFWFARSLMAAVPALALSFPVKKLAAGIALGGASFYLVLSGAGIATQRAFVMVAVMLLAVLLDRPAITIRNVALAALVILLLRPESVLTASFQMSFAATAALVAAYEARREWLMRRPRGPGEAGGLPARTARAVLLYITAIAVTTVVASLATAPFAAYHFHRVAPYGLIANLLAMPAVALIVMPAGLVSIIAVPFGIEPLPLAVMGAGIDWVLASARLVAGLPGAALHVAQMPLGALGAIVLGALWLILWRRPWRLAGLVPIVLALALAPLGRGPDLLIDRRGTSIALRPAVGEPFWILARNTDSYTVGRWLERDGDFRGGADITKGAFSCDAQACAAPLPGGGHIAVVMHRGVLAEECARARIVVARFALRGACRGPELVLDARTLEAHGTHAVWLREGRVRLEMARPVPGARPWAGRPQPSNQELTGVGRESRRPMDRTRPGRQAGSADDEEI
jgi:competence protein ComEC